MIMDCASLDREMECFLAAVEQVTTEVRLTWCLQRHRLKVFSLVQKDLVDDHFQLLLWKEPRVFFKPSERDNLRLASRRPAGQILCPPQPPPLYTEEQQLYFEPLLNVDAPHPFKTPKLISAACFHDPNDSFTLCFGKLHSLPTAPMTLCKHTVLSRLDFILK